jgi:hypothetical protein
MTFTRKERMAPSDLAPVDQYKLKRSTCFSEGTSAVMPRSMVAQEDFRPDFG